MLKNHQTPSEENHHRQSAIKWWQNAIPESVMQFLKRNVPFIKDKTGVELNFAELKFRIDDQEDKTELAYPGKIVVVKIGKKKYTHLLTGKAIHALEECTFSLEDAIGGLIFGQKAGWKGKLENHSSELGILEEVILKKVFPLSSTSSFLERWLFNLDLKFWENKVLRCTARYSDNLIQDSLSQENSEFFSFEEISEENEALMKELTDMEEFMEKKMTKMMLLGSIATSEEFEIIDPPLFSGRALPGVWVTANINGQEIKFLLDTIDTENGVSIFSPLGGMIFGKKIGATFESIDETDHGHNFFGQITNLEQHQTAKKYMQMDKAPNGHRNYSIGADSYNHKINALNGRTVH